MTFRESANKRFGAYFHENEPIAKHLNIRIGGPARFFVEARTSDDLCDAVRCAREYSVPFFVLGGGSNTLVADDGFDGVVIKAANRNVVIHGDTVVAEAGAISASVARLSASKGLRGFEWAISLPGTVGGAVRGNAGCFGGEMKDVVESAHLLRDGQLITVSNADLRFGYRMSALKEEGNDDVVVDVTLRLSPGDADEALALLDQTLERRKASQPLGSSSAGCMFTNVAYASDADVSGLEAFGITPDMRAKKRIPAGWIIDKLGLKGTSVGDAQVSEQHGNFMLNKGRATAQDMTELIALIKSKVLAATGIELHEEVKCIL